ncbi:hypothetical protein JYU34_014490 [Plutella xylostella]|uniref:Chemosensory protein 4 n=2 Tax=Plutella xylostella TaxID=51655 RepID=A2TIK5_PLUXY|nr:ejaculatory bulb-specific protein 3-like precursor [Plutella xylostella]ABM92664.1 chemosensory protein CSP4 [Plutella xylostella]ACR43877.1 chemosensory protein 4 [Plutella xylostella]KAG7301524.1 hypothetical protein JYU34_014490 [Plutella xylostella]WBQ20360.1 chemosensory protein 2 [Plutella xylostella]
MQTVTLLCLLAAVAAAAAAPADTYDAKYDSFNAHELVQNQRLLKSYGKCFLSKGPCTAEGSDFKRVIPEALKTTCGKCTRKQRELVRVVVKGFQEQLPQVWTEIVSKEDPKGEYKDSFAKFLEGSD